MKTLKLDLIFSHFIRLTYAKDGEVKCFTCAVKLPWLQMQNGHFIKRSNMATRYSEVNCKPQCPDCNHDCHYGGEKQEVFEQELRKMYGDATIDDLIQSSRLIYKYSQYEIDQLEKEYKKKVKQLQ